MKKALTIISKFIFENYMWFLLFNGLVFITIKKLAIFEYLTFPLIGYILFLKYGKNRKKINLLDFFFIILIIWTFITWAINLFEIKPILIIRHLISQVAFMLFYYIGRNYEKNINVFFKNAFIPLFICSIIGIYWYFFPPGWYMNNILSSDSFSGSNNSFMELSRLRSFYPSPYEMAYMSCIVSIYIVYLLTKDTILNKYEKIMFITFLITLILCMMRAPILIFIICSSILILKNFSFKKTIIIIPSIIVLITIITTYCISFLDNNTYSFFYQKFSSVVDNIDGLLISRINMMTGGVDFSLLGDGAGKHALHASKYGEISINDSEYVKYMVEQGYIGLTLFILLILVSFYKAIKNFKFLSFEFCILLFYTATMIGANSISTADKHCFIFWLIIGRISSFNKNKKLLYI